MKPCNWLLGFGLIVIAGTPLVAYTMDNVELKPGLQEILSSEESDTRLNLEKEAIEAEKRQALQQTEENIVKPPIWLGEKPKQDWPQN